MAGSAAGKLSVDCPQMSVDRYTRRGIGGNQPQVCLESAFHAFEFGSGLLPDAIMVLAILAPADLPDTIPLLLFRYYLGQIIPQAFGHFGIWRDFPDGMLERTAPSVQFRCCHGVRRVFCRCHQIDGNVLPTRRNGPRRADAAQSSQDVTGAADLTGVLRCLWGSIWESPGIMEQVPFPSGAQASPVRGARPGMPEPGSAPQGPGWLGALRLGRGEENCPGQRRTPTGIWGLGPAAMWLRLRFKANIVKTHE
jgi:hypothetical protein